MKLYSCAGTVENATMWQSWKDVAATLCNTYDSSSNNSSNDVLENNSNSSSNVSLNSKKNSRNIQSYKVDQFMAYFLFFTPSEPATTP